MRATEAQWHAKTLGAADGHVCAELARRGQQGQGQQVGGYGHQCVGGMEALNQFAIVEHVTVACGVLQQGAEEDRYVAHFALVGNHYFNAQWLGTGAQHVQGLRVTVAGGEKAVAGFVLAQAFAEGHGFGSGGGFVEQRGVGDRQAAEVADQGLEVKQRFETALGNFRLVGRVGGVPGRVFQEVAQDRRRRVAVVVTLADIGFAQLVFGCDGLDRSQGVGFALPGGQVEHAGALDAVRDHAGAEAFQGIKAQSGEHRLLIGLARADVARDKFIGSAEIDGHGGLLSCRLGL